MWAGSAVPATAQQAATEAAAPAQEKPADPEAYGELLMAYMRWERRQAQAQVEELTD